MKDLNYYLKFLLNNPTYALIGAWVIVFPLYILYKYKIGSINEYKSASVSKYIRSFEKYRESTKPKVNKGGKAGL